MCSHKPAEEAGLFFSYYTYMYGTDWITCHWGYCDTRNGVSVFW